MTSASLGRSIGRMFDVDEFGWEPEHDAVEPGQPPTQPEPGPAPQPEPGPAPQPAAPREPSQGATHDMYEPPPVQPDRSTQWAEYEPTTFVPPHDDFAPGPPNVPMPPPGRHYAMYRQPPTWQHASLGALGGPVGDVIASFVQNLLAIAAGAGVGYLLTGSAKGAIGGGLVTVGAVQVPHMFGTGGFTRAAVALGALGGAYLLLREDSPVLVRLRRNAADDTSSWESASNWQDDEDEDSAPAPRAARPSTDPGAPGRSAPWMREVV